MVTCPKKTRHFAGHKFTLLFVESPVRSPAPKCPLPSVGGWVCLCRCVKWWRIYLTSESAGRIVPWARGSENVRTKNMKCHHRTGQIDGELQAFGVQQRDVCVCLVVCDGKVENRAWFT